VTATASSPPHASPASTPVHSRPICARCAGSGAAAFVGREPCRLLDAVLRRFACRLIIPRFLQPFLGAADVVELVELDGQLYLIGAARILLIPLSDTDLRVHGAPPAWELTLKFRDERPVAAAFRTAGVQSRHRLRLAQQSRAQVVAFGLRPQHLESRDAPELRIVGSVHRRHSAGTQRLEHGVSADDRALTQGPTRCVRTGRFRSARHPVSTAFPSA
jgi:hypothetical protein